MSTKSKVTFGLGWRLSLMWALQWGITGAILTYMPIYFEKNGLSKDLISRLYAVSALGLWVAPFVVGQVCDRWMSSEKYLAIAHFFGGVTLLCIPVATEMFRQTDAHFSALMVLMGAFAVFYFPTIPLASSMTFRHLPDPERQFGKIRIWGTVGWVMAGWFLSIWLGRSEAYRWLNENIPSMQPTFAGIRDTFRWLSPPTSADCFKLAALLAFALSSFCVFLPPTPPAKAPKSPIAPLAILSMFKDKTFSLLIGISFLLALFVPLYALAAPLLLNGLDYSEDWVPALMTLGQISEFPALLLMPLFLKRFGLKATFAIGMGAWLVRYSLFMFKDPAWLILTGISLHGICHVFLIIVIQLFVDRRCQADLRATAQNLFAFITMGIAMPLGLLMGGQLLEMLTDPKTLGTAHPVVNYQIFFSIPAVAILILLILFAKFVKIDEKTDRAEAPQEQDEAETVRASHSL